MRKSKIQLKICSLLIVAVMIINSMLPIIAYAESETYVEGDFEYTITNNEVTITKYKGKAENLEIPSKIANCQVTTIGSSAFSNCTSTISIKIPEGVKTIKRGALGCNSLTNVIISSSVTNIEELAFWSSSKLNNIEVNENNKNYSSQNGVLFNKDKTVLVAYPQGKEEKTYNIPDGVVRIGKHSFMSCENLTNIVMSDSITIIEQLAFDYCRNLRNINWTNNVMTIEDSAFASCFGLTNVQLPAGIVNIGNHIFSDCRYLKNVNVDINNKNYMSENGIVFNKNKTKILIYPAGKEETTYTIPEGVCEIGEYAFYDNGTFQTSIGNLQEVIIPNTVKSIGKGAFAGCGKLKKIAIPEGVPKIEDSVFWDCNGLDDITIPKSVVEINKYAFTHCHPKIHGYTGSYAETYANKNNLVFISLDSGNNNSEDIIEGTIDTSRYILIMSDSLSNRISNQKVTINGEEKDINNGIVLLDKTKYEVGQTINVKIVYNNEEYYLTHKIKESGQGYLRLPKTTFDLIEANANEHDVLTASKVINLGAIDTIEFELKTANTTKRVNYKIYQEDQLLGEESGISSVTIEVNTENMRMSKNIYARIYDENGNLLSDEKLKITSIQIDLQDFEIDFGKDIEVTFPEFMGPLEGSKIKIPLKALDKLPLQVELSNEKIKVGVTTFKDKSEDSSITEGKKKISKEKLEKDVNEILKNKKKINSQDKSISLDLVLYNEMNFDKGVLNNNQSFGALKIQWKNSTSHTYFAWVVPITTKITFSASGTVKIGLEYDFDKREFQITSDVNVEGSLKANAGIGISWLASAGIYGKIKTEIGFGVIPNFRFKEFIITGEAGLYAEFFGKEGTWSIIDAKSELKMDENGKWTLGDKNHEVPLNLYSASSYKCMTTHGIDSSENWIRTANTNNRLIQNNIYTYTNQKIVKSDTDVLMLLIDSNNSRDDYNFKTLKYSIYDAISKTWSTPEQLDKNNTQDNSFSVFTDGSNIYVAYSEEKADLAENSTMEQYAENQEISIVKWNTQNKQFEEMATITNNSTYDMLPTITVIDNIPIVAWVNNASNSPFGMTTDNSILYSKFENSTWSEPQVLTSGNNVITDLEIGKIGNENYIIAIVDGDNDLSTEDDRNMKAIDFNGNQKLIETSALSNINTINYQGNNVLTWYNDRNIKVLSDINGEIKTLFTESIDSLTPNHIITKNGNNLIIVYLAPSEEGYSIYKIIQDEAGRYGEPIEIIKTDNSITCYDVLVNNDELLLSYTETTFNINEDDIQKTSNLYSFNKTDEFDIEILDIEFDKEKIKKGENANISVYVKNNAEIKANTLNITIADINGNEVYNKNLDKEILSGVMEKIDISDFVIGDSETYTATISETNENDINEENNRKSFNVKYSDLNVTANQVIVEDGNYALVKISNEGNYEAENVQLNILKGDTIVATQKIENIPSNYSHLEWVYLKDEYFDEGRTDGIIAFTVTTDTEEVYESNNEYFMTVVDYSEEAYLLGDINGDGKVNTADFGLLNAHLRKKKLLTGEELARADINGDGKVNTADFGLLNAHLRKKKLLW